MLTENKMSQTMQVYRISTNTVTANREFSPKRYIFIQIFDVAGM